MFPFFADHQKHLLQASRKEQLEAIEKLIGAASVRRGYYLLLILSSLIVTAGLLTDQAAVIIGGMILAPIIVPILSLALSLLVASIRGIVHSLWILFLSILTTWALAALMTFVTAKTYDVILWIPETINPGIYLFIAFCSGVAAAFAWVKEELAPTIAGVAIAVSLLPPLCAAGIAIALGQYDLLRNSLVLFLANFLGILLAAFLVFWILGFLTTRKAQERALKRNGS